MQHNRPRLYGSDKTKFDLRDVKRRVAVIENTLAGFGIPVKVVEVKVGPRITQFGLEIGFLDSSHANRHVHSRKVSVNRITVLQHDLELALAAAPLHIIVSAPGQSTVALEVPNQSVSVVSLRDVFETDNFRNGKLLLKVALGSDMAGEGIVADLTEMPHLLIAGATGTGKSVCINAIIASLLFQYSPDYLRLILVDPKRVELGNLNDIPHLLGPVVVNMDEVAPCLRWLTREMDNRFILLAKEKVRNIDTFNEKMDKTNGDTMPYIVALIDALEVLAQVASEAIENSLMRLVQMAHATGIHLVIATQRPSVDVVSGLVKAGLLSRISFAMASGVDSRVMLETMGAEKLLGKGDMLFKANDSTKAVRGQGCFVSDDELARLVHFWREKAITDMRDIAREAPWRNMGSALDGIDDDLIEQAIEIVRQSDRISISFLQRKLGIGYPRAARLMDQLEERGVVGAIEGDGMSRVVLLHAKT
jgi:S-DNA-T family DNA segregation ATPase FtsK/SpoIIIE